jgi:hypothetical protein
VPQHILRCRDVIDNDKDGQFSENKDIVAAPLEYLAGEFPNTALAPVRKGLLISFLQLLFLTYNRLEVGDHFAKAHGFSVAGVSHSQSCNQAFPGSGGSVIGNWVRREVWGTNDLVGGAPPSFEKVSNAVVF